MSRNARTQLNAKSAGHFSKTPKTDVATLQWASDKKWNDQIKEKCQEIVKQAKELGYDIEQAAERGRHIWRLSMKSKSRLDVKAGKMSSVYALSEFLRYGTCMEVGTGIDSDPIDGPRRFTLQLHNTGVYLDYGDGKLGPSNEVNLADYVDCLHPIPTILDNLLVALNEDQIMRWQAVQNMGSVFETIHELAERQ